MTDDESDRPSASILRPPRWATHPANSAVVDWGALSHAGSASAVNTESFFVGRYDRTLEPVLASVPQAAGTSWHHDAGFLALLADGIHPDAPGEVASRTAIQTLLELAVETPDWIMRYDDPTLIEQVKRRIVSRLRLVDQLLSSMGVAIGHDDALAASVTILAVLPPDGIVAHVGRSRAYLQRAGALTRLTRDHTAAQAFAEAGVDRTLAHHPNKDVLMRAVGFGDERLVVDMDHFTMEPGDRVTLCSDGLADAVSDDDLAEILTSSASSAIACRTLVDRALAVGVRENVTVIVGRVPPAVTR